MTRYAKFIVAMFAVLTISIGCDQPAADDKTKNDLEEIHSHEPGDELVWEVKKKIDDTDIEIWLGHHGNHFHAGDKIEPSVAIVKAGESVADAKVFNQLVNPDDPSVTIGEEVATVYEPESEDEIAHYAQGDLMIPADATSKCLIRYRIEIPDMESMSMDAPVKVGH